MIKIRDLNHVSLVVSDFEACRRFYNGVLGMDEVKTPFRHRVIWLRKGGAEIHCIHAEEAAQQPGDAGANPTPERDAARARHLAFEVEDMDETMRTLQEHGVEIVIGPRDRGDGVSQMYCFDPDGHLVELCTATPT